MAKAELWLHYKPSLFQHIGTHSSLKGKVQKLKVSIIYLIYILENWGWVCWFARSEKMTDTLLNIENITIGFLPRLVISGQAIRKNYIVLRPWESGRYRGISDKAIQTVHPCEGIQRRIVFLGSLTSARRPRKVQIYPAYFYKEVSIVRQQRILPVNSD